MLDLFIPERVEDLTPEWLSLVLRERDVLGGARVSSARHEQIGDGEGFVGVITRLFLELDPPGSVGPRTLIAKLPTPIAQNRVLGELLGAYEREILFYEELAPELPLRVPATYYTAFDPDVGSRYQEQIVGLMDRLPVWLIRRLMPLARWVAGRKKRRYVLLMEDLTGARLGDQVAGARPEDCGRALQALAGAHAALWESPLLQGRFWLARQDLQSKTRHTMYRDSRSDFALRFEPLLGQGLDALLDFLDRRGTALARRLHRSAPQTLVHGDFRLDNIFFDGRQGEDEVVIIDWQLAGRGSAAYDVAYLLGGALPVDLSREGERSLLHTYHDALEEGGVTNYGYSEFARDYERGLLTVLQTIATTDVIEMGQERGVDLIDVWVERLLARSSGIELATLL